MALNPIVVYIADNSLLETLTFLGFFDFIFLCVCFFFFFNVTGLIFLIFIFSPLSSLSSVKSCLYNTSLLISPFNTIKIFLSVNCHIYQIYLTLIFLSMYLYPFMTTVFEVSIHLKKNNLEIKPKNSPSCFILYQDSLF